MTVLCSVCHRPVPLDGTAKENRVYKLGELAYIELAHPACAPTEWKDQTGPSPGERRTKE